MLIDEGDKWAKTEKKPYRCRLRRKVTDKDFKRLGSVTRRFV
jgi:hypothetical protein